MTERNFLDLISTKCRVFKKFLVKYILHTAYTPEHFFFLKIEQNGKQWIFIFLERRVFLVGPVLHLLRCYEALRSAVVVAAAVVVGHIHPACNDASASSVCVPSMRACFRGRACLTLVSWQRALYVLRSISQHQSLL